MTRKQYAKEATRKQLIWFAVALATNLALFAWHQSGLALYFMMGISTVHLFLAEQYHTGKIDPPKWVKERDEKLRWG